jgi:DNA-binding HxlR family transcriptional regulator
VSSARFEFPAILKYAIEGFDNPLRWKILEYLVEHGETSYSNLLKALNINNKGKLTFHLRELSKNALLNRFEVIGIKTGEKSFYDISPFGRSLINGLMSAFTQQLEIRPWLERVPETSGMIVERTFTDYTTSGQYSRVSSYAPASEIAANVESNSIPVSTIADNKSSRIGRRF